MQLKYVSYADKQLTGSIPILPSVAVFLNMSSNLLTDATFSNLPASLQLLYLAKNNLSGSLPPADALPTNLTLLDLSYNRLSGSLPSTLPANLAVLNVSNNNLIGTLPSNWSTVQSLAEVRLDQNAFTGKIPAEWSAWGQSSKNSLQLSLVNANLHGTMPQKWVEQFCVAIFTVTEPQVLFQPVAINLSSASTVQAGPLLQLSAQHASINVSLEGKLYGFSYDTPDSMCGIPNALRNVALVWGVFAGLLLAVVVCVLLWLRRSRNMAAGRLSTKLTKVKACFNHSRLHMPKKVSNRIWFLLTDVVYFMYSQVTNIITIHQVFQSGQLEFAYPLLALLLLPYAMTYVLVTRILSRVSKQDLVPKQQCIYQLPTL